MTVAFTSDPVYEYFAMYASELVALAPVVKPVMPE